MGWAGALGPGILALISIHSASAYEQCAGILRRDGLRFYNSPQLEANLSGSGQPWRGDPDLIAIGAFCIGTNQIHLDAATRLGIAALLLELGLPFVPEEDDVVVASAESFLLPVGDPSGLR